MLTPHFTVLFTEVQQNRMEQMLVSLKPLLLSRATPRDTPRGKGRVIYDVSPRVERNCEELPYSVTFTDDVSLVKLV